MTAVGKIHTHYGVARLAGCEQHCKVCTCARVGLYVAVLAAEKLIKAFARQVLDNIHELAAAVIALTGVTLGVFVG